MSSSDKQTEFLKANAASMRALAGGKQVQVRYAGHDTHVGKTEVRLPALAREGVSQSMEKLRGASDSAGLWLAHHNEAKHNRLCPQMAGAKSIFEAAEQARIEAIGSNQMAGVRKNLTEKLNKHYEGRTIGSPDSGEDGALAEAVRLTLREVLTGEAPPASTAMTMELWRPWIQSRAGALLEKMQGTETDQLAFAKLAKELIGALETDMGDASDSDGDDNENDDEGEDNPDDNQDGQDDEAQSAMGDDSQDSQDSQSLDQDGDAAMGAEDGADMDGDPDSDAMADGDSPGGDPQGQSPQADELKDAYQIYTKQFDEVIDADELCDNEELDRLRAMLDRHLENLTSVIGKLANRLQRKLMAYQNRSWDFDLEEGILDAGKLHRVVTQPLTALSYKQEQDTKFRDTVVTLLLDNSGSMRGRPITIAAVTADILARTLERCGVKVEILGFTTKAWKGGKSREAWQVAGKPEKPGRLNDLRHIIYKGADTPWRRARRSLGLMLREGILKENIDGEALSWAHDRLMSRQEDRRILMVISDGAPVDDSTLSSNSGNYLEKHLRLVIDRIESRSPVELMAIGIGHDVNRYYANALTITDVDQLGGAVMSQLADLFDDEKKPKGRK